MQIICPLYNSPYYSYTIDLSGETYTLTFRYSSRSEQYLLDIANAEEENLIRGIGLVPYYQLLQQYSLEAPIGEFILLPIEETGIEGSAIPDPRRIDKTHTLFYTDEL